MENKNPGFGNSDYDNNGLTPEELVKKHMLNPKHVVTEDEMQHMKVGEDAEDEKEVEKEVDEKEAEIENSPDSHASNPYDLLGE